MSEQMRIMRSKELPEELRDRIVARHRSGQGYKNISAALKVPKSTVASIILKWKTFGTTRTLPRAGRPAKLSYWGRRALVREVKKNPKITVAELQRCIREMGESCWKSTVMITYNIYIVIRETGQFSSKGIINDFLGNLNRLTVSRRFTEQAV